MKRNMTEMIEDFHSEMKEPHHRYYSFDFCYAHFRQTRALPAKQRDIEKSCQVLWSYLASWGMLRGSSFLLQKNPAYLKELVEWIYEQPESTWEIDVEHYDTQADVVLALYNQAKEKILKGETHQAVTLTTKILLGVFAIVPAFDRFFKETFSEIAGEECGFSILNKISLDVIHRFYLENQQEINQLSKKLSVCDFNGQPTSYHYSQAKIIDMYGFRASFNHSQKNNK